MWWIVILTVMIVPVFVSPSGQDAFRAPKDGLMLATALLLGASALLTVVIGRPWSHARPSVFTGTLLAGLIWAAICAGLATNPAVAWNSLLFPTVAATFVLSTVWLARGRSIRAAYVIAIPVAANAVVFLCQRFGIWDPLHVAPNLPNHERWTALVGNPNDVGSFFVAPALAVVTLAVVDRQRRGWWAAVAALVLAAIVAGSLTAIVATVVGLFGIALVHSRRRAVTGGIAVLLMTVLIVVAFAPLRERLLKIRAFIAEKRYEEAFSGRVTPFLAAWDMTKDHPLTGVGPGCFAYEYFPYKVEVERRYPNLLNVYAHHFNFAQVHNDHLQTLAETGVIGYAIALGLLALVARGSFRKPCADRSSREEFSRLLSLPLTLALATLCIAHFPLHLTAPVTAFGFVAALCVSWRADREVGQSADAAHQTVSRPLRYAAVAVATAILVPALYWFVVAPYRCNIMKRRLERSTLAAFGGQSFRRTEVAHSNISRLLHCLNSCTQDVQLHMLLAANQRILGRSEDALATYSRALNYDRRPEIYYNIGMVQLDIGRRADALRNLHRAVLFDQAIIDEIPYEDVRAELKVLLERPRRASASAL